MFCTPTRNSAARKAHQCTYCGEAIEASTRYFHWSSVDDSWFHNKMHPECKAALDLDIEGGDGTYFTFDNERPNQ